MIEAVCDCGAVRLEVGRAPEEVWECLCDGCRRMGVTWAYYHPSEVRLAKGADQLTAYQRGGKTQDFFFCRTCGCTTHWASHDADPDNFGVNARLLPKAVRVAAPVLWSDGP